MWPRRKVASQGPARGSSGVSQEQRHLDGCHGAGQRPHGSWLQSQKISPGWEGSSRKNTWTIHLLIQLKVIYGTLLRGATENQDTTGPEPHTEGCSKDLHEGCTTSLYEEPKLPKTSINTFLLGRQRQSGSLANTIAITIPVDQEKRERPSPPSGLLLSPDLNAVRPGLQARINDSSSQSLFSSVSF